MGERADRSRPPVAGVGLDAQSRCVHYHGEFDVVAIRMRCCGVYHACRACHDALAGHAAAVWPVAAWGEPAILCGVCGLQMSVWAYLGCASRCPGCEAPFNPGCAAHHHLYFESLTNAVDVRARG